MDCKWFISVTWCTCGCAHSMMPAGKQTGSILLLEMQTWPMGFVKIACNCSKNWVHIWGVSAGSCRGLWGVSRGQIVCPHFNCYIKEKTSFVVSVSVLCVLLLWGVKLTLPNFSYFNPVDKSNSSFNYNLSSTRLMQMIGALILLYLIKVSPIHALECNRKVFL